MHDICTKDTAANLAISHSAREEEAARRLRSPVSSGPMVISAAAGPSVKAQLLATFSDALVNDYLDSITIRVGIS